MDIIAMLEADHEKANGMLESLEQTTTRAVKTRTDLFAQVTKELLAHMEFEEAVLYPAIKAAGDAEQRGHTLEAYAEHEEAKVVMAKIHSIDPSDEMWKAHLTVLKENITHHVKEEEQAGGLFAMAKKLLPKEDLVDMAERYAKVKAAMKPKRGDPANRKTEPVLMPIRGLS